MSNIRHLAPLPFPVVENELAIPRYRKRTTRVESDTNGRKHRATYPLWRVFGPRYDVSGTREHGRALLTYRLELVTEGHATTRLYDHQVAFRCEPVPCGKDAKYIQLPTVTMGPFVDLDACQAADLDRYPVHNCSRSC